MSIWVSFQKDGWEEGDKEGAVCEQAIAFLIAPENVMQHHGVNASFIRAYRTHANSRPRPTTMKEWLVYLLPWLFPVDAAINSHCGYWPEGSKPFTPDELLNWATRWRQLMEYASPDELELLFEWLPDDDTMAYLKESLETFQDFARKAAIRGWRIRMFVV